MQAAATYAPLLVALFLGCSAEPPVEPGHDPPISTSEGSDRVQEAVGSGRAGSNAPETLASRIAPPPGFRRVSIAPTSYGAWLRNLPLRPGRPDVHLHDGRRKDNQDIHHAVVDIDVGTRDLQQCADAVIRLRAEYLFSGACSDEIHFDFTSGHTANWRDWRDGIRPEIQGNRISWVRSATPDDSYESFRAYLEVVFTYAGSASLEQEMLRVDDPSRPRLGDVFIQGGFPGHAVLVVDVAKDSSGQRIFLLAQSYMPAQDIHILRCFEDIDPWYRARTQGALTTPEWVFDHRDLRRFRYTTCELEGE